MLMCRPQLNNPRDLRWFLLQAKWVRQFYPGEGKVHAHRRFRPISWSVSGIF
jgi:hypothetical protein